MFERPDAGERAVLLHIDFPDRHGAEDLGEFRELVVSAGAEPVNIVRGTRKDPNPGYFVGSGKLETLKEAVQQWDAEVVLVNHTLSPTQERNLERALGCRVIDRTSLILDIFAQRARTYEGKLQVELAQLRHLSTRLVRGWTHLERQKGGIGLRGPGETQLETDRRLIRDRIRAIQGRLEKVRSQRAQGRRARQRAALPTISLVGYTNAGKSTLFNGLTSAGVFAKDQLFATLDPTLRRIRVQGLGPVILADTVGFIAHLPHQLVEAFRATLEETTEASLLLHVIDASDPRRRENTAEVETVLRDINADKIQVLEIYNKVDLVEGLSTGVRRNAQGIPDRVWLSAQSGEGLEGLVNAIREVMGGEILRTTLRLSPQQARFRAALYDEGCVLQEKYDEAGHALLEIEVALPVLTRLAGESGEEIQDILPDRA